MKPVFGVVSTALITMISGTLSASGQDMQVPTVTTQRSFVYCTATSNSPRGRGLIVTGIFNSRSSREFIETAFSNYLRGAYAPYGNSWIVADDSASCALFPTRRGAELRRSQEIALIPQPTQTVYQVSFQIG